MILCEEPWYNEPGREAAYQRGNEQSPTVSYNQTIRQHTVRTAMLEWLNKTPPLWKDVVDQHFTENANKILQTVLDWSKSKTAVGTRPMGYEDDFSAISQLMAARSSANGMTGNLTTLLPQLQAALRRYGAKDVVPDAPQPVTPQSAPRPSRHAEPYVTMPPYSPPSYTPYQPPSNSPYSYLSPFTAQPTTPGPNYGGYGHLLGPVLGASQIGPTGGSTAPSSRGGATAGGLGDGHGRYETRSSTRGRGGPSLAANPGGEHGSVFGGDAPRGGRGGYGLRSFGGLPPDRGRGGRGGRGGQAGYQ
jgi:hypothetical protein